MKHLLILSLNTTQAQTPRDNSVLEWSEFTI